MSLAFGFSSGALTVLHSGDNDIQYANKIRDQSRGALPVSNKQMEEVARLMAFPKTRVVDSRTHKAREVRIGPPLAEPHIVPDIDDA